MGQKGRGRNWKTERGKTGSNGKWVSLGIIIIKSLYPTEKAGLFKTKFF